jgi:hypothetical protein
MDYSMVLGLTLLYDRHHWSHYHQSLHEFMIFDTLHPAKAKMMDSSVALRQNGLFSLVVMLTCTDR